MRRNPQPAITSKMYRHFATMTVAITALIALFASGEQQDAVAAEAAPQQVQQADATPKPSDAKAREKREEQEAQEDTGTWGSDEDFGHSSNNVAYDGGSWSPSDGPWQSDLTAPIANREAATLTASERDDLARALAKGAPSSAAPSGEQS